MSDDDHDKAYLCQIDSQGVVVIAKSFEDCVRKLKAFPGDEGCDSYYDLLDSISLIAEEVLT